MIERFRNRELAEQEQKVLRDVEGHGWSVMNIREQDGAPGWAFTIGLFENYRHPEVAIFGMQPESRHKILNWIGDNARDGNPFESGPRTRLGARWIQLLEPRSTEGLVSRPVRMGNLVLRRHGLPRRPVPLARQGRRIPVAGRRWFLRTAAFAV
jgi:hypothetical protein